MYFLAIYPGHIPCIPVYSLGLLGYLHALTTTLSGLGLSLVWVFGLRKAHRTHDPHLPSRTVHLIPVAQWVIELRFALSTLNRRRIWNKFNKFSVSWWHRLCPITAPNQWPMLSAPHTGQPWSSAVMFGNVLVLGSSPACWYILEMCILEMLACLREKTSDEIYQNRRPLARSTQKTSRKR